MFESICYKVNYIWRVFGTGVSFLTFGIGGLLLSFFVFPPVLLLPISTHKRKRIFRLIISYSFRFFMHLMHYLGLIDFRKKSIEILKNERSCLLIANHPTLIDVVSIIAYCPNACCIVKEKLWNNFYIKRVLSAAGYIPNKNADELLTKCDEAIKSGDVLIIFPEGTRTVPGKNIVFQRGASHIALMLKCPVRCVSVSCDPITLTKGLPWYKVPSKRALFTLEVKDKLNPASYISEEMPRPKAARVLTRLFLKQYCSTEDAVLE